MCVCVCFSLLSSNKLVFLSQWGAGLRSLQLEKRCQKENKSLWESFKPLTSLWSYSFTTAAATHLEQMCTYPWHIYHRVLCCCRLMFHTTPLFHPLTNSPSNWSQSALCDFTIPTCPNKDCEQNEHRLSLLDISFSATFTYWPLQRLISSGVKHWLLDSKWGGGGSPGAGFEGPHAWSGLKPGVRLAGSE